MLWHISFLYVHVLWSPPKQMVLTTRDMYLYICVLICWAGFPELNQDDQLILIKCGFFEVWLMRMARMFNKAEGCLTFEDGSIIQKEELGVVFSVSLRPQENHWCLCCSNFFEKSAFILLSFCAPMVEGWGQIDFWSAMPFISFSAYNINLVISFEMYKIWTGLVYVQVKIKNNFKKSHIFCFTGSHGFGQILFFDNFWVFL